MYKRLFLSIRKYTTTKNTVDPSEIAHFGHVADEWWDKNGRLRALHTMNHVRIPFIQNCLIKIGVLGPHECVTTSTSPQDFLILDVGCGGGILTEGLSRLGYNVTGLDPNPELIDVAKFHVKDENIPQLRYECSTIEEFTVTNSEKYNVVVSSETIEHVTEKEEFLKSSIHCLKPGGSLFITTINKTWPARFSTIYLWEDVFKCAPKGTHEYDKFIGLNDLIEMLSKEKCTTVFTSGLLYNPYLNKWYSTKNKYFSYALHAIKVC